MKHAQASAILNGAGWKYLSCFLFIQSEYNLDKPSSDVCRRRRCRRHYTAMVLLLKNMMAVARARGESGGESFACVRLCF